MELGSSRSWGCKKHAISNLGTLLAIAQHFLFSLYQGSQVRMMLLSASESICGYLQHALTQTTPMLCGSYSNKPIQWALKVNPWSLWRRSLWWCWHGRVKILSCSQYFSTLTWMLWQWTRKSGTMTHFLPTWMKVVTYLPEVLRYINTTYLLPALWTFKKWIQKALYWLVCMQELSYDKLIIDWLWQDLLLIVLSLHLCFSVQWVLLFSVSQARVTTSDTIWSLNPSSAEITGINEHSRRPVPQTIEPSS